MDIIQNWNKNKIKIKISSSQQQNKYIYTAPYATVMGAWPLVDHKRAPIQGASCKAPKTHQKNYSNLALCCCCLARVQCVLVSSIMGYWDLEEGKDCVEKTWITTKLGTALGEHLGNLCCCILVIFLYKPGMRSRAAETAS